MKKKVFSLMMMLLLAYTGFVRADELTVHDGSATNGYVPVYGFYADAYLKSEMVYPASELSAMNGGQISSMAFGISSPATEAWTGTFEVFVKEVSDATINDFSGTTGATTVYTGTLDGTGSTMTVNFTAPYTYNGGNLLVGFYLTTTGNYKSITWAGETVSGASVQGYDYSSLSSVTASQRNFLPKTTFTYSGGGGGGGETVEVTIGDPTSTTSSSYLPTYSLYEYSLTQQIYTADEIGVGGTINSLTMWLQNTSSYARNLNVYMKEVSESTFASGSAWVSMTASDLVGSFTLANGISSYTETTVNLSTPFSYSGNGNLLLCVQDVTGSWSSGAYGNTLTASGNQAIYAYRDGTVYNPTTPGVTGYTLTSKNVLRLSITTEGGGGGGFEDKLHVRYMDGETEVIDSLYLGVRPLNAWTEPFAFQMYTDGPAYTVNVLDFTPSDGMFSVEGEELPFQVVRNADVDLVMGVNATEAGLIERQFVAITEGDRAAHIWPVMVEVYDPAIPDVWEKAYDFGTISSNFTYQGVPSQITPTELHNDYTLPFPEIEEGVDAVYKFTVPSDMIISAHVDENAENGKVALYTEDFNGEGGPMATNNYTGLAAGGGAAATPFEAQIGEGTTTTTYFPFYTFYNYCIAENLFLAAELAEAGVTTAPMTSLSWYATNAPGYNQQGITIWMANVDDTELTTTSHPVTGMTKVYTGAMTPAIGWNEFVFNEGTFSWDGNSNVLIYVQRNNGEYNSSVSWQATASLPFTAMSYRYQDSGAYDPTIGNTMYTSTTRANIIMKGGNREGGNRDIVEIGDGTGTTYYFPIDNYFNYSCTEQIYTADEIGTAGTINSISFYYNYGTAYTANNVTMYMKNVSRSEFTSNDDCEPLALSDIVWTGNIAPTAAGWYTFNLDTPFYFDGTSNLLVAFFDGTSGYPGTSYTWRQTTSPNSANMALRYYSDSSTPDPYNLATYGGSKMRYTYRSNIQLDITPGGSAGNTGVCAGPVIESLPVRAGVYYLVASATQADYDVYINAKDMPCPAIDAEGFAFNPVPADDEDEIEPASVTLRWMVPEYATGWRLIFGSTYHPDPNHPQTIMYPEDGSFSENMVSSYTVRNLWNNTNYFWRVEFNNGACPDGVSSPVWGFTTHLNVPQNLTAVDETVFNDEQIVLNWTAVVDRTFRTYNVYRDGELIGSTQVNNIGNATYTDGPLPYNMNGYSYYVTAVYDEGESAPSNTVVVKVSGRGNVDGHVYEQDGVTGIAGATVTMVGQDEFGVTHTYNFITNGQGYYSGAVYAGSYNGQAACNGYQTIYEPVQGNPIAIVYNETTSPIDYILDENFDPVCAVIAEYYPDSLDPNSPYVKVYWGCGLPGGEIIEDFETGDFSMFDWQLDNNYPWSVTTYQPYEGTYCMKSGGAGVPSVTSNMTVTVDIPADGIMSYYGKISCENNWDYGYFFIDGVQKAQYTGVSNWAEKHFDITAGTHTFQWRYTKDGSVDSNDDCFYVDYIAFYKQPEPPQPAQPGWHTYAEGDFNNAVGSNVGTSRWAYEYPVSVLGGYAGFNMTKVSLFSDNMYSAVGGNYTCTIYQGGDEPMAGTAVSTITVDVPANQNAWVDFDLTTPVSISGNQKLWVVWTANTTVSSWPAGCTDVSLIEEGTWWSAGVEAGYGWEHETYGTWTMRQYFTNREGRGFYSYAADNAPVKVDVPQVVAGPAIQPVKGQEVVTTTCATSNPQPVALRSNVRSLDHYNVYRTNCYNDGPYTEENTVFLATVWVPDTVYIDVEWYDLPAGVYKWGVSAVYSGNRGELVEGPINWTAPTNVSRSVAADNDPNPVSGEEGVRAPWDLMHTFNAPEAAHYGVVTDGQYIYTSNWGYSSAAHNFYKYDMQGNMIEGFEITGCGTLRGMTFDGQYVYGVANSNTVYCVDLNNHSLVTTFTSAYGAMRGITYDPQRDGFWVIGNWSGDLTLINRQGAVVTTGPTPTSVSDLAYYKDENDVEHVFCFNNGDNGVYDYNITTNTLGGSVFNFSATPGFNAGTSGGCHVAEYNGKVAFFGDIQQDPNLIGIYELKDGATPGPTPGPTPTPVPGANGLAEPRQSEIVWSNCLDKDMYLADGDVTINVLLNSADNPEGTTVDFLNYNEAEQELYPMDQLVLDETGYYVFPEFRRGDYQLTIRHEGYETIIDSVSIWDPMDLRYVMIEIIYAIDNLYVSSTGWAMWDAQGIAPTPGPGPQPGPGGAGSTFSENCDNGMPAGWTTVDADGDGYIWVSSMNPGNYHNAGVDLTGNGHNGSAHFVLSGSWANGPGIVLYPDNYLVSPQVTIAAGSTFSFWACAQDANYPADHFGVAISDNGTSNWTMVNEWTMTAKSTGAMGYGRNGEMRAQGNWYQYSVDLSAYAGQKYIAIRHFNCSDQFIVNVDDIELTSGSKSGERHLEYFKVMCESLDHEPIFNADTEHTFCQVATDELVPGEHYLCKVAAVYSTGMSAWVECEWQYIPCTEYAGTVNGLTIEGTTVSWDYPGVAPGPGPQPGQGSTFSENFDAGMPAGWTTVDANNDNYDWVLGSQIGGVYLVSGASLAGSGHNASADLICSGSYSNATNQAITPDNYLVSPQVTLTTGSTFSFWACAQDSGYPAEHFGVFISDNGTSDWTEVQSWTMTAKSGGNVMSIGRGGATRAQGNWYNYSVDLSAFAGQKYIAIRHFACNDQFILDVDDIELTVGSKSGREVVAFNGFVTDPGAMANGADASWTKNGQATWGPNVNNGGGYKLADSFTLSAATTISEIEVYGYQTGSSTTSTFTGLYAQIYDGNPMSGGNAIWGSETSNIMTATSFTNCYRGSDGETTATTRPIMAVTAGNLNIDLAAGTYWLVYSLEGTGSSGPWGAPHAEPTVGNTGNGVQYTSTGWQTLVDGGTGAPYGCSMKITGNGGTPGPTPTPGEGNVLGAMLFLNGEWEAFVPYPTNEYTYAEGGEYCVRMVYDGTNTLPEGNIYYSMSCPECEGDVPGPGLLCEPGAPIHGEVDNVNDVVKIWWGVPPAPPMEEWLYYDDGVYATSVGTNDATATIYWATMFPAESLVPYAGTSLTKVAVFEFASSYNTPLTVTAYLGGTTAPGTAYSTKTITPTIDGDFDEITLDTPVAIDGTQNLWIVCSQMGTHPAQACADSGEPNNRWISLNGTAWQDLAAAGLPGYGWLLRGFVTNQAKGIVNNPIDVVPQGEAVGELSHTEVVSIPAPMAFMSRNRATLVQYNVYRSTDNETYTMIGSVAEDGSNYYEYLDTPGAGNYYYQVRALYDDDCESDPAPAYDNPTQYYVEVAVTGIGEMNGEVALFPNPTKDNVTIQAAGMTHVTVVSVLGQVVYDAEVNADELTLNMSQFNAGMYTVRIATTEGVAVRRVTVVR